MTASTPTEEQILNHEHHKGIENGGGWYYNKRMSEILADEIAGHECQINYYEQALRESRPSKYRDRMMNAMLDIKNKLNEAKSKHAVYKARFDKLSTDPVTHCHASKLDADGYLLDD